MAYDVGNVMGASERQLFATTSHIEEVEVAGELGRARPPICSDSARNSAVSRDARSHAFQRGEPTPGSPPPRPAQAATHREPRRAA